MSMSERIARAIEARADRIRSHEPAPCVLTSAVIEAYREAARIARETPDKVVPPVTDREALIAICEHMGLRPGSGSLDGYLADLDDDVYLADETRVAIGAGKGYGGFFAVFAFDADGRAVEHGVWE